MKKLIVLMAIGVLSVSSIADLAFFQFEGGKLYDDRGNPLPSGSHGDIALIFIGDYTGIRDGGWWGITDFEVAHAYLDIVIAPPIFDRTYQTEFFSERPSTLIGETITLVIDPNGGGLEVGDIIGISDPVVIQDMADVGDPFPSKPQIINSGDIFINVQEIPEPSTISLMGIAAVSMFYLRKKQFR